MTTIINLSDEVTSTKYEVSANGTIFGQYDALSERAARDMCAQDAGYESEADMALRIGQPSDLVAAVLA